MIKSYLIVLFLYYTSLFSQVKEEKFSSLLLYQDTLNRLQYKIFKSKSDGEKIKTNRRFTEIFQKALDSENSFDFNFDSLTTIARLASPDKAFKIYNWNLPKEDGTYEYFGFIQVFNPKTKKYFVYPLRDKSQDVVNPEKYTSDNNKWYGMLYYKIITRKYKNKAIYTLLAWDGNDKLSSKKIIDVLYFTDDGSPHFGDALFEMGKRTVQRVVFEHSAEVVMSLKYDEQKKMIVFDHLAPPDAALEGQYQFYGPDMSYDGFQFKKGKWIYVKDVDAKNAKSPKDRLYNDPKSLQPENMRK